ncbi:hypothetical protein THAOC_15174 [Thalassiosira oceanica]|uniref:B30.2/SPRY domain-containing protein n=1 Tax=Thalassiosira oceanica TaxID=159749 RepID=K0SDE8_THAOC|nr:hypothetical protein THAOC_15174 [Thalassiosira oceanica]|eukprot:EJK64118.1 hypothetical protein THAOC_15174 [Thalassiosira oceanica]
MNMMKNQEVRHAEGEPSPGWPITVWCPCEEYTSDPGAYPVDIMRTKGISDKSVTGSSAGDMQEVSRNGGSNKSKSPSGRFWAGRGGVSRCLPRSSTKPERGRSREHPLRHAPGTKEVADEMTEKERRTLYVRGSMISVYDLLLRHRAPLEFTLLLGRRIRYTKKRDKSTLTTWNCRRGGNTAVARDFVMRRGRHFARFQVRAIAPPQPGDDLHVGVIRPISRRILDSRMDEFSPFHRAMKLELLAADGKQAQEWEDGSEVQVSRVSKRAVFFAAIVDLSCFIQACEFISTIGRFRMTNWDEDLVPSMEEYRWNDEQNFFGSKGGFHGWAQDGLWTRSASDSSDAVIGLLLDLEQGTLSAYLDDDRIGVFSDRTLSGEYCWFATAFSEEHCQVSIERAAVAA